MESAWVASVDEAFPGRAVAVATAVGEEAGAEVVEAAVDYVARENSSSERNAQTSQLRVLSSHKTRHGEK